MMRELSIRRRVLLAACLLTVFAYAAAVACILINFTAAVWIVNLTTLFYLVLVRGLDRRYNRAFARANLSMSCGRLLSELEITEKGTLTREELCARKVFPLPEKGKGVLCGMQLTGRQCALRARVCEITTWYDMSGEKKKLGLLNGLWLEVLLPADAGLSLSLLRRDLLNPEISAAFYARQQMNGLPILETDLREHFVLYGDAASAGFAARFLRRCLPLLRQTEKDGCRLLLSVRENRLCLFLSGRSLTFSTPIRGKLTPEIIGWERLPELGLLLELAAGCG